MLRNRHLGRKPDCRRGTSPAGSFRIVFPFRNKAEINRVLATERIDPDAALLMLWAMDLTTGVLRAQSTSLPRRAQDRASKPNEIYEVTRSPLFRESLSETLPHVIENTKEAGGRGYTHLRGNSRP